MEGENETEKIFDLNVDQNIKSKKILFKSDLHVQDNPIQLQKESSPYIKTYIKI